jgi:hypothetical protein
MRKEDLGMSFDKPFEKGDRAVFLMGSKEEVLKVESCEPVPGTPCEFEVKLEGVAGIISSRDLWKVRN